MNVSVLDVLRVVHGVDRCIVPAVVDSNCLVGGHCVRGVAGGIAGGITGISGVRVGSVPSFVQIDGVMVDIWGVDVECVRADGIDDSITDRVEHVRIGLATAPSGDKPERCQ